MPNLTDILECPVTRRALSWTPDGRLAGDKGPAFAVRDGIACLLPPSQSAPLSSDSERVREFYEGDGWAEDDKGMFGETKTFADTRQASLDFTNRCIARLGKYFSKGGTYLLDAGSGPIPYDALRKFGDRFEQRVCVDLSVQGLRAAQRKIGDRGVYLQGDLTNLPLKSGSMDAVTCNHVIYQIPPDLQAAAFRELWRVLKPGGVAVVVYLWPRSPLAWRLEKLAKRIFGEPTYPVKSEDGANADGVLPHNVLPLSWFQAQDWPFSFTLDTYRVVSQPFMSHNIGDDWRGRIFLNALYALQVLAPGFCGKYGTVPAIIIRKPKAPRVKGLATRFGLRARPGIATL